MEDIILRHVYGNVMRVAIPLTQRVRTLVEGMETETETDFYPNPDFPVKVNLTRSDNMEISYEAEVDGNVASIEDKGEIPVGTYGISVLCYDNMEQPCRYMARKKIKVVAATKDAGIEAGVEFNTEDYTLEGTIFYFAKGDKGDSAMTSIAYETDTFIETLSPNVYHKWDEVEELTIDSLGESESGTLSQFMIEFRSGDTPTALSLPDSISWNGGVNVSEVIKPNKTYQISIINYLGVIYEF